MAGILAEAESAGLTVGGAAWHRAGLEVGVKVLDAAGFGTKDG